MDIFGLSAWARKKCRPCEGGVPPVSGAQARENLKALKDWALAADGRSLRADYLMKDFAAALDLIARVGRLADEEDHHPDLHLTGYRKLQFVLSTHAIGGLSENDFILAAKIESLKKDLKAA